MALMSETHAFPSRSLHLCRVLATIVLFAALHVASAGAQEAPGSPADRSGPSSQTQSGSDIEDDFEDDFFEDEFGFDDQTEGARPPQVVADPLKPLNKAFFVFNDRFYFWILKPVAQGYRWVLPTAVRTGVSNFFVNLFTPIRFTNCLLQGKVDGAATEYARFVTNTTIGVLGFGNPAKNRYNLEKQDEDFGQTLAVWGVGNGFFVTLPFLGPSTLRDGLAIIPDWYLSPVTYLTDSTAVTLGTYFFRTVNETSFRIGDYEAIKEAALDPYEAVRDGYIQFRRAKVEE
jgi:phospholipid-binding lipoprotein MlaA